MDSAGNVKKSNADARLEEDEPEIQPLDEDDNTCKVPTNRFDIGVSSR